MTIQILPKCLCSCIHVLIKCIGAFAGRGLYTETVWPFHIIDLNCTGMEKTVWECSHNGLIDEYNCPFSYDASVRCQGLNT